jgi:hypothetical protein
VHSNSGACKAISRFFEGKKQTINFAGNNDQEPKITSLKLSKD